jgi:allantoicase
MSDFTHLIDLAAEAAGGQTLHATDDFFAAKENLLKAGRGVFIPEKFTENGKWMDGWESRRKRVPGHDVCLIRLGLSGVIRGLDVDTNHFTGNYPEHASVEACEAPIDASAEALLSPETRWTELLPITKLEGGSQNLFPVASDRRWTHLKLHIYPDGGVARLRVHGEVLPDWKRAPRVDGLVDLAAVTNGGVAQLAADMYFGHMQHLIMPGDPVNMGGGWETRRRRGPGNDWIIVRLGANGVIRRAVVDTMHFKGNYPDRCSIEGCRIPRDVPNDYLASRSIEWVEILASTKLQAHMKHPFEKELRSAGPFSHVRLNIYPDGGVARLRLWGTPQEVLLDS